MTKNRTSEVIDLEHVSVIKVTAQSQLNDLLQYNVRCCLYLYVIVILMYICTSLIYLFLFKLV